MWIYNNQKHKGKWSRRGNASYGNQNTFSGDAFDRVCRCFTVLTQHQHAFLKSTKAKHLNEIDQLCLREQFYKCISEHNCCGPVAKAQFSILNCLINKVIANVNMLYSCIGSCALDEHDG